MSDKAKIALSSTFAMHALAFDTPMPVVESIPGATDDEDLALTAVMTREEGWSFWLAAADVYGEMTLVQLTIGGAVQLRETLDALILEGETAGV
jgi:hypothetical protein